MLAGGAGMGSVVGFHKRHSASTYKTFVTCTGCMSVAKHRDVREQPFAALRDICEVAK